ncbi:MAG TPA: hypothetical protein VGU68_11425, partial [Ktedonobacteraceae bacterium]|nr:hypothetical protein [Ktedonobacteraceae bacterium]
MPKRDQQHPAKGATGHNNPKKTTEHSREHSELEVTHKANSREREEDREQRSGSDSNAHKHRKDSHVHEHDHEKHDRRISEDTADDFSADLTTDNLAGEDHGLRDPSIVDYSRSAESIKALHTMLADLTDDELRNLNPVIEGSRLEQGAMYIDLKHLEQGEFKAVASMTATPDHLYVAKKDTD